MNLIERLDRIEEVLIAAKYWTKDSIDCKGDCGYAVNVCICALRNDLAGIKEALTDLAELRKELAPTGNYEVPNQ